MTEKGWDGSRKVSLGRREEENGLSSFERQSLPHSLGLAFSEGCVDGGCARDRTRPTREVVVLQVGSPDVKAGREQLLDVRYSCTAAILTISYITWLALLDYPERDEN